MPVLTSCCTGFRAAQPTGRLGADTNSAAASASAASISARTASAAGGLQGAWHYGAASGASGLAVVSLVLRLVLAVLQS